MAIFVSHGPRIAQKEPQRAWENVRRVCGYGHSKNAQVPTQVHVVVAVYVCWTTSSRTLEALVVAA